MLNETSAQEESKICATAAAAPTFKDRKYNIRH
jgi:hypothetical protein